MMTNKYDHLRFAVNDLIPTKEDLLKVKELFSNIDDARPFIEDENTEKLLEQFNKNYIEFFEIEDESAGYLFISAMCTYKALQVAKENIKLGDDNVN